MQVVWRVLPEGSQLSYYLSYQVDALGSALTLKADLTPGQTMRYALLHAAAANGQLEMARELLERGANVDVLGSGGETACGQSASLGSAPQPLG